MHRREVHGCFLLPDEAQDADLGLGEGDVGLEEGLAGLVVGPDAWAMTSWMPVKSWDSSIGFIR